MHNSMFLNRELNNYINTNNNCKLIFCFLTELLEVISAASPTENKDQLAYKKLDQLFLGIDLKESFQKKLIIVYIEMIMPENLIQLHRWLARQCCNIENIVLVNVLHAGLSKWYNQYIGLYGEPGMKIVDATWLHIEQYYSIQNSIPQLDESLIKKNLNYYFNYWGGTYPNLERDLTALVFSTPLNGYIDYVGCSSSDLEFDNYLEQHTWFTNRKLVDRLLTKKQQNIKFSGTRSKKLINDYCAGFQFEYDSQSAMCPIRETLNDVQYSTITEKTIRAFIHFQIPLPISGVGTVDELKKLGFQFCDLVDYDKFQHEPRYLNRLLKVCEEITRIQNTYSLSQLQDYIIEHRGIFFHNYNLIQKNILSDNSAKKVISALSDS